MQGERGDFILLVGASGSGKTTLIRSLMKEIAPIGFSSGEIVVSTDVGFVQQDPEAQIVMDTVWKELVFAMENKGFSQEIMELRAGEMVSFFGMEKYLHKNVNELSGGQKQILNLASVMILRPEFLILDEPTSQLDPVAAREFLDTLRRINHQLSTTIVITEHRIEDVIPIANIMAVLENGELAYVGSPREVIKGIQKLKNSHLLEYIPIPSRLAISLGETENLPINISEGKKWIESKELKEKEEIIVTQKPQNKSILKMENIHFEYEKHGETILRGLNIDLKENEFFTILGGNGSGKSTMMKIACGIYKPVRGKVKSNEDIGYLHQNPMLYFNQDTVKEQLEYRAQKIGISLEDDFAKEIIITLELKEVMEQHPYDLSGGQMQKLAIALVLLKKPQIIFLDEPTKGLDPHSKNELAKLLDKLMKMGKTILSVSHDIEFTAQHSDRCGFIFDGKLVGVMQTREFFSSNYFYTTAVNRIMHHKDKKSVLLEDVTNRWKI